MIFRFRAALMQLPIWAGLACVSGCAVYHPAALPATPDLAAQPSLSVPAREFWLPGLKPHAFPQNGLDETAVVTLAVFDNPDLKAARLQAGVASAQVIQAGLLPDPQLNADFAKSALNYGGDVGLTEDIQALITRGARKAAAKEDQRQVHLAILWQEWLVAERVRQLFIQSRADDELHAVLSSEQNFLAGRYHQDEAALQRNDITLSAATADLSLLTDAETRLRQVELDQSATAHQLDQLLGLRPEVRLHLIGSAGDHSLSKDQFQAAVAALPHRRADLLALQAGYEAQQSRLREAILAQFPNLSAGVVLSRDPVEGVNNLGPEISLSLPIFNRNRGQVVIERATRAVLRQTYQARLDQAEGEADQVWRATNIMQRQLGDLDARLAVLRRAEAAARQSFQAGNLSAGLYVNVESSLLSAEQQAIQLRASLANARSALDTLLGQPLASS